MGGIADIDHHVGVEGGSHGRMQDGETERQLRVRTGDHGRDPDVSVGAPRRDGDRPIRDAQPQIGLALFFQGPNPRRTAARPRSDHSIGRKPRSMPSPSSTGPAAGPATENHAFTDSGLLSTLTADLCGTITPARAMAIHPRWTRAFLDTYIKGYADTLPAAGDAAWPEVTPI